MTLLAKQLVKAYYGRDAKKSYFTGCSTGGEQALMEAQRFPDDYDGIVGGAPAHNRTGVHVSILWNFAVPQRSAASYLPPAKISLLSEAVVRFCDALDGVKDGLITDPRVCSFDPASLQCKAGDGEKCLTAEQVTTVKALYAGPTNSKSGKQLYPGLQMGSEFGWTQLGPAPNPGVRAPYSPVFEWVFEEKWNWRAFDFDQDVDRLNDRLAETLNATNPDLDAFRSHGHKLLLYHGWGDSLVAPGETINYFEAVRTRDAELHPHRDSVAAGESIDASVRLFMVPGMGHCGGGPGAASFDPLSAMVKWVEDGTAPDALIATKSRSVPTAGSIIQQRLLCPYPQVARYTGAGNTDDASTYACAIPNSATNSRNPGK
jgi:feruloyl esterase